MRGMKAKNLRRMRRADLLNGRSRSIKQLRAEFPKGQAIGVMVYYPRPQNWNQ